MIIIYFHSFENKMFIETLLGSKVKAKLLRVLSERRTAFTLQDLKNETELSLGIIHKSIKGLVEEGILIKIKGSRKERLFKFNTEDPFAHNIFELFEIEKTLISLFQFLCQYVK